MASKRVGTNSCGCWIWEQDDRTITTEHDAGCTPENAESN